MSRLILTMGRTARTPYLIEKIERKVYTIEELCYSLAQCAQLLDDSIRDPDLVIWLGSECGLTDLSVKLRPWLDRRNAYVEFVMVILEYAAYQSPARQKEIRREMEERVRAWSPTGSCWPGRSTPQARAGSARPSQSWTASWQPCRSWKERCAPGSGSRRAGFMPASSASAKLRTAITGPGN